LTFSKVEKVSTLSIFPNITQSDEMVGSETTPGNTTSIRRYTTEFGTPDCFRGVLFGTPRTAGDGAKEEASAGVCHSRVGGTKNVRQICEVGESGGGGEGGEGEHDESGIIVAVRVRPFTARYF